MTQVKLPNGLSTDRLILRRWKDSDVEPFVTMNCDPEVMRFYPSVLTREQSIELIDRIERRFESESLGLWATEVKSTGQFIGYVGLWTPGWESSFTPCVEIGWRICHSSWGKGYAPEAAREVLRDGFERLQLKEILSWTATVNQNSMRVMQKIGMYSDPSENFMHPAIEEGSPLKLHVLYRLTESSWIDSAQRR